MGLIDPEVAARQGENPALLENGMPNTNVQEYEDKPFEVTEDGTVPLVENNNNEGPSLLRYSNKELGIDPGMKKFKPEKRKAVGKVKYKGKPYYPPERNIEIKVKQKKPTNKVPQVE